MPRTPRLEGQKISLPLHGSGNFFGSGTAPPPPPPPQAQTQKPSYGPVVYSLWVGWCLFKSGTLPLTLHKFIKIVYFSIFSRKTPRRAKPFQPRVKTLSWWLWERKLKYMVPTWLQKFLNGPASFWDLFSSYLAQSSYLIRNINNLLIKTWSELLRYHNLIWSLNCLIQVESVRLRQWRPCYGSLNVYTFFDSPGILIILIAKQISS